jgi:hypothetical protein
LPIARALVLPPDESGSRIAHVLFRTTESPTWKFQAFVDLSKNEVRDIGRVR